MTAQAATSDTSLDYARDLTRAVGGALLFALPLLMTMEMWALGFSMERERLILFVLLGLGAALVAGLFALASSLSVLRRGSWGGHQNSGGWSMGSGSWSGGSHGGFRSGGGGDFGGGGASGRW